MENLNKEHNPPTLDFNINDCITVVNIYCNSQGNTFSKPPEAVTMLNQFQLAYGAYQIAKSQNEAPTNKQLEGRNRLIRNKANKLLSDLKNKTDAHFLTSLACSMAGTKTPITIDDEKYRDLMTDIYQELGNLGKSLQWLSDNLEPIATGNFDYLHTNKKGNKREFPENAFIKDLSLVLTKHLDKGGYAYNNYTDTSYGWKIDCINYLLKQVCIKKTKSQIKGALSNK